MVYMFFGCGELCLQIRLSIHRLGVMFGIGLVFLLVVYFFYMAFCCYAYYHRLFVSCLGWCACWAFFLCFVISISTELLCFGRGI